jgi:hypothetical protein
MTQCGVQLGGWGTHDYNDTAKKSNGWWGWRCSMLPHLCLMLHFPLACEPAQSGCWRLSLPTLVLTEWLDTWSGIHARMLEEMRRGGSTLWAYLQDSNNYGQLHQVQWNLYSLFLKGKLGGGGEDSCGKALNVSETRVGGGMKIIHFPLRMGGKKGVCVCVCVTFIPVWK